MARYQDIEIPMDCIKYRCPHFDGDECLCSALDCPTDSEIDMWELILSIQYDKYDVVRLYRNEKDKMTDEQINYVKTLFPLDCEIIDSARIGSGAQIKEE